MKNGGTIALRVDARLSYSAAAPTFRSPTLRLFDPNHAVIFSVWSRKTLPSTIGLYVAGVVAIAAQSAQPTATFAGLLSQGSAATAWLKPELGLAGTCSGSSRGALNFRFIDRSVLAQDATRLYSVGGAIPNFQDGQFHGGTVSESVLDANLTNCLPELVFTDLEQNGTVHTNVVRNNNFFDGRCTFDGCRRG